MDKNQKQHLRKTNIAIHIQNNSEFPHVIDLFKTYNFDREGHALFTPNEDFKKGLYLSRCLGQLNRRDSVNPIRDHIERKSWMIDSIGVAVPKSRPLPPIHFYLKQSEDDTLKEFSISKMANQFQQYFYKYEIEDIFITNELELYFTISPNSEITFTLQPYFIF